MKILVVEDDPLMQTTLRSVFREAQVFVVDNYDAAIVALKTECFMAAFLDIHLRGNTDGVELLKKIRERDNYLPCVMISGVAEKSMILRCLDGGAVDYVVKAEGNPDAYRLALHKALQWKKLLSESQSSRTPIRSSGPDEMFGQSSEMNALRETIRRTGRLEGPFLILGETGSGKELVARQIWSEMGTSANPPRPQRPFIALNCASLPSTLVESELFGYEKGAFTGALGTKTGLFEAANGGDIFLDEIGELTKDLQAKLLRVLQEKKVRRVGSDRERPVDFRVIAATNVSLTQAIESGEFRDDLFYRLNVHQIHVPSLRDRKSDIQPLLENFISQQGLKGIEFEDRAQVLLQQYHWPGNIRQLKALSQYLVPYIESDSRVLASRIESWVAMNQIGARTVSPSQLNPESEIRSAMDEDRSLDIVAKVDSIQKSYVESALKLTENNRSRAAKVLGVSRQRLSNWLMEWGLG